jgi:hypothetical protein
MWKKLDDFNTKLNEKIEEFKQFTEEYLTNQNESFDKLFTNEYHEKLSLLIPTDDDDVEIHFPQGVPKRDKVNIVLIGPTQSGKTSILKEQVKKQFRGVVSIKNLLQWNLDNGHPEMTEKIATYTEEKKKEYEEAKVAYDKLAKQAKSNKKMTLPEAPSENMYKNVSKEIFAELLTNRISQPDCNCGCVFDDLESEILDSPETVLEYLDDYFVKENLYLAYFDFPKDKDGYDVCHYIDWSNYVDELNPDKRKPSVGKKSSQPLKVPPKKTNWFSINIS